MPFKLRFHHREKPSAPQADADHGSQDVIPATKHTPGSPQSNAASRPEGVGKDAGTNSPPRDLWDEAYTTLRTKNAKLVQHFEQAILEDKEKNHGPSLDGLGEIHPH